MSKKIYVGNLAFPTLEEELVALFGQHGTVLSAKIIRDRHTDRSKGFAFVEMSDEKDAAQAIQKLQGQVLHGNALKIDPAN